MKLNSFLRSVVNDIQNTQPNYIFDIKDTKWTKFKWKGLTLMKDPMTLTIYQQLIQDIKPKTIIEFGTYDGGSALWMKDLCKSLSLDTKVITIDIKPIEPIKEIEFINLDVNKINDFQFSKYESPIIVIEDCHENLKGIFNKVDNFLKKGDYFIVEDTLDISKYSEMIKLDLNKYKINRKYCDFWGKNNTWNCDSFFEKINN
jgi:cephalosporin hydroxylase